MDACNIERMFEGVADCDLIDVMGEATRDESTAIAQRLAAVAELLSGDPVPWLSVSGGVPMLVMRWPRKCRRRSPTGHTYVTEPHGASMFPTLAQSTGALPRPTLDEPSRYRDVMMPRRKQTREQNRRDRINAERRERTELIAEEERQRQAWLAANYEPPPF